MEYLHCFLIYWFQSLQAWSLAFYDSVLVYAHAMDALLKEEDDDWLEVTSLECWTLPSKPWDQGDQVYKALTQVIRLMLMGHVCVHVMMMINNGWKCCTFLG